MLHCDITDIAAKNILFSKYVNIIRLTHEYTTVAH